MIKNIIDNEMWEVDWWKSETRDVKIRMVEMLIVSYDRWEWPMEYVMVHAEMW